LRNRERIERGREEEQERLEEERERNDRRQCTKEKSKALKKKQDVGRTRRPQNANISSTSSNGSEEEEEDDDDDVMDDVSVYLPKKKQGKIQTLEVCAAADRDIGNRGGKKRKPCPTDDSQDSESDGEIVGSSTDKVKVDWAPLHDDPWGPEGYAVGDVLLYGPDNSVGYDEPTLDPKRYKVDPFGAGSSYRSTHNTPEEGLSLVSLERDQLGRIPWGFEVARDEFGHACLVISVDHNSPASAANWIGGQPDTGSTDSRLQINDMVSTDGISIPFFFMISNMKSNTSIHFRNLDHHGQRQTSRWNDRCRFPRGIGPFCSLLILSHLAVQTCC
jgi:hypothetical protein